VNRPWWRIVGLAALLACLALFEPGSPGIAHRLIIPLLMAIAAWAMVQNVAAVALGIMVLTYIHTDLSGGDWIGRWAYPLLAAGALLTVIAIAVQRFRRRITETHEARWSTRRSDPPSS